MSWMSVSDRFAALTFIEVSTLWRVLYAVVAATRYSAEAVGSPYPGQLCDRKCRLGLSLPGLRIRKRVKRNGGEYQHGGSAHRASETWPALRTMQTPAREPPQGAGARGRFNTRGVSMPILVFRPSIDSCAAAVAWPWTDPRLWEC